MPSKTQSVFFKGKMKTLLVTLLVTFPLFTFVSGSEGDMSPYYQSCVSRCFEKNCTEEGFYDPVLETIQPFMDRVMQWTCSDECQYDCMWKTVDAFRRRGWSIPQFYGKWPFVRIFGMQEVASVTFSAFNFIVQLLVLIRSYKELGWTSPSFFIWIIYSLISLNSWTWSMVFHAKDTPFTESMDYLSAFSVVVFFLFCFCSRVFGYLVRGLSIMLALGCIFLYLHHATYLLYVKFDYGYNMLVNITVGVLTSLGWLFWCWRNRLKLPYVRHLVKFLLIAGLTMTLEVLDFPPIFWIFDAHSLWHLSTVPLPIFLFRFVTEDCNYLNTQLKIKKKTD